MTWLRLHKRGDMQSIFRSVYEENLRISGRPLAGAYARPQGHRHVWLPVAMAVVLLTFDGNYVLSVESPETPVADVAYSLGTEIAAAESQSYLEDSRDARLVPLAEQFGLGVKTIVIDPGHGGRDPGAVGPTDLMEKSVALDIALRLRRRLEAGGLRVLLTRDSDTGISLKDRVDFAIETEADLFVSVHANALPETLSTVETYYFGTDATEASLRLARRENESSGYSFFEWQRELGRLGNSMKISESRLLASAIQTELFERIREVNPDVIDWGTRPGPFQVLFGVPVPAVLAEISVISTPEDEALLYSDAYLERVATALEVGILTYLGR